MVSTITSQRWLYRALFVGLAITILFFQVLPIGTLAGRWPGPDLMFVIAMAWGLRRPDYLPPLLVAAVFLMSDLILQRPPGLWTALVIIALDFLRARDALWRDLAFPLEWALISAVMAAVVVVNQLVLALFMVEQLGFGLSVLQLLGTVLVYPLVVAASATVLGVRKVAPGEVDSLGHRL